MCKTHEYQCSIIFFVSVPNITTTIATTTITTTLASFTESQQGDMDDIKIELSGE